MGQAELPTVVSLVRQFSPPASSSRSSIRSFSRDLRIVAAHLLDEALRVLTADEHLELDAERKVGGEGVVHDREDDHYVATVS